jgi:HTH-type transcriptional repressor of NAD biosynthesis genes
VKHGLVVGKFCPFHEGHVHLIDTAVATCGNNVTVVIYDMPGFPQFPIEKRAAWIEDHFPYVKAIVPIKDQFNGDSSAEASPLYAGELEKFGPFTHVFSSEDYGPPFAEAFGAEHVMVDQDRIRFPVSGTGIREDAWKMREYIPGTVYRDLIQKVAFLGGESTGKTTLAERLATEFNTEWVHEYGRELWEAQGGSGSFSDLLLIGETQYDREERAVLESKRYLFCDTTAMTTEYWCRNYYGTADPRLVELVEKTKDEYVYFLCSDDFPYVQDGLRETEEYHERFHQGVIDDLDRRGIQYQVLKGSIEDRVKQVKDHLGLIERNMKMIEKFELDVANSKLRAEQGEVLVCE